MFEPKSKTITLDGQEVTLRQLSLGETNTLREDADMATIVAMSWDGNEAVTDDQVRKWPHSIVKAMYDVCVELNGLDEGN